MDDLAAWLAQIWDEQEKVARIALQHDDGDDENRPFLRHAADYLGWELADHIAANDPASVLARIAAARQILALHSFHMVAAYDSQFKPIPGTEEPRCDTCASQDENGEDWPCDTIRLLAQPYADRPGYQETWRLS